MKSYNANSKCYKCGNDDVNSSYHPPSDRACSHYTESVCYGEYGGHILRTCKRCHHEWHELPLDEKEPNNG